MLHSCPTNWFLVSIFRKMVNIIFYHQVFISSKNPQDSILSIFLLHLFNSFLHLLLHPRYFRMMRVLLVHFTGNIINQFESYRKCVIIEFLIFRVHQKGTRNANAQTSVYGQLELISILCNRSINVRLGWVLGSQ